MNKIECVGSCTFSCNMIMAIKEINFTNVTVYHTVILFCENKHMFFITQACYEILFNTAVGGICRDAVDNNRSSCLQVLPTVDRFK